MLLTTKFKNSKLYSFYNNKGQVLALEGKEVYASFVKRYKAMFIDIIIIAILMIIIASIFSSIFPTKIIFIVYLVVGFSPITLCLYRIICHCFFSATIGKMAMKIKVLLSNGHNISFQHAVIRSTINIIIHVILLIIYLTSFSQIISNLQLHDWSGSFDILPNWYSNFMLYIFLLKHKILSLVSVSWIILNIMMVFFNKRKRAIYDFIANTIVINKR